MNFYLIVLSWFSAAMFMLMAIYKFIKLSSMPLHLRLELYPVDHEIEEKRKYGGSYLEEMDWVKKPILKSLVGEIIGMGSEIFFLHRVKEHNPYKIWIYSMAMHWGIYLLLTWIFLLAAEVLLKVTVPIVSQVVNYIGIIAFIFGAFGSLMLIIKRITVSGLKIYSAPVDYFNLMFLLSIFATGLISCITDPSLAGYRTFLNGVITFKSGAVPLFTALNFILFDLFLIYMPFTKLFHYVAKYFTFHKVLWDDSFKTKGSEADKKITEQLSYNLTWQGPHIKPGISWLEEAKIIDGGKEK